MRSVLNRGSAHRVLALLLLFACDCGSTVPITVDDTARLQLSSKLRVTPSESIVLVDPATTNVDNLTSLQVLFIADDDNVAATSDGDCISVWARFYDYGPTELKFCPVPPRTPEEPGLVRSVAGGKGKVVALGDDEKLYKLVASEWRLEDHWGWVGKVRIANRDFYAVGDSASAHLLLNVDVTVHGVYNP